MKVREIMTKHPVCCDPGTTLAAATGLMWANDCGVLPVLDHGKLSGIITDRDISVALGTRNRLASELAVSDVAAHDVHTCSPNDDIHTAMATMRRAKVRRLPVVQDGADVVGLLSLNDLILAAERRHGAIEYQEVMNTIKAVSEHRAQPVAETPKPELVLELAAAGGS